MEVNSFVDPVRLSLMLVLTRLQPLYAYLDGSQTIEPTDEQIIAIGDAMRSTITAAETEKDERTQEIMHMAVVVVEAYLNEKMEKK